jgi:hypothetical protein
MNIQMETLLKHLTNTSLSQVEQVKALRCDFYGQGHANGECVPQGSEEVNYVANLYSQAYQNNQVSQPSPLERTLTQFIQMTQANMEAMKISQEMTNKSHEVSIKNLETQMGQLCRKVASSSSDRLVGNKCDNHKKESCNAIHLRNRVITTPVSKPSDKESTPNEVENEVVEVENERNDELEGEIEKESERKIQLLKKGPPETPHYMKLPYPHIRKCKSSVSSEDEKKMVEGKGENKKNRKK